MAMQATQVMTVLKILRLTMKLTASQYEQCWSQVLPRGWKCKQVKTKQHQSVYLFVYHSMLGVFITRNLI